LHLLQGSVAPEGQSQCPVGENRGHFHDLTFRVLQGDECRSWSNSAFDHPTAVLITQRFRGDYRNVELFLSRILTHNIYKKRSGVAHEASSCCECGHITILFVVDILKLRTWHGLWYMIYAYL
jgi:hypothetical protein